MGVIPRTDIYSSCAYSVYDGAVGGVNVPINMRAGIFKSHDISGANRLA